MISVLKIAFLVFILLCGLLFLVVGLQDYAEKAAEGEGALHLFVVFLIGVLPFAGGLYGLYKQGRKKTEPRQPENSELPEVQVMKLATRQNGKVTIPEVAILLGIRHKKAEELLERMRGDGAFELEIVPDTGAIIYFLTSHASPRDKESATGILD